MCVCVCVVLCAEALSALRNGMRTSSHPYSSAPVVEIISKSGIPLRRFVVKFARDGVSPLTTAASATVSIDRSDGDVVSGVPGGGVGQTGSESVGDADELEPASSPPSVPLVRPRARKRPNLRQSTVVTSSVPRKRPLRTDAPADGVVNSPDVQLPPGPAQSAALPPEPVRVTAPALRVYVLAQSEPTRSQAFEMVVMRPNDVLLMGSPAPGVEAPPHTLHAAATTSTPHFCVEVRFSPADVRPPQPCYFMRAFDTAGSETPVTLTTRVVGSLAPCLLQLTLLLY